MAELSEAEQADITCATDYLMRYEGRSKFMLDLLGKAQRIDGFTLSIRQAQVVLKIADEEFAKAPKQETQAQQDDEPF